MAFEKAVEARIAGFTSQNSDVRMLIGDSSGGVYTSVPNPLRQSRFWDRAVYVLTGVVVAGGATGGSYTVTLQTDAIAGYTGLPIASAAGIGPNSAANIILTSAHNSPCSPIPTHIFVDQTATGGAISFQLLAIAKQYRGTLSNSGSRSSERVLEGELWNSNRAYGGPGLSVDTTVTLTATGTSAAFHGLDKMRMWDNALYWFVAGRTIAGTWDADVVTTIGGQTFVVATTGTGGALNVAGEKLALTNNFFGCSPRPSSLIITEVSAGGVSDATVVFCAKSGRGSATGRG